MQMGSSPLVLLLMPLWRLVAVLLIPKLQQENAQTRLPLDRSAGAELLLLLVGAEEKVDGLDFQDTFQSKPEPAVLAQCMLLVRLQLLVQSVPLLALSPGVARMELAQMSNLQEGRQVYGLHTWDNDFDCVLM